MTTTELQPQTALGNLLLGRLAVHERNAVQRGADRVALVAGDVLLRADTHSEFVFFPISCVASVIRTPRVGAAVELALIGNEGMVGLDVFMEAKTQPDDVVVQSAGWAYRMPGSDLYKQFRRGGSLQRHLLRFTESFLAQVAQTAVCARFHTPEARLARWLLMIQDRTSASEIRATPESMKIMLGIEPARVAQALNRLAAAKGIVLRQQSLKIVDREGLEANACECYETLRQGQA